jgi:membrane protein DedA with SNARE-associated domain
MNKFELNLIELNYRNFCERIYMGMTTNLLNYCLNLVQTLGYWGVFVGMSLNMTGIEVPSEVIMPFAGFAVAQGSKMTLWGLTIVGALGEVVGALIVYGICLKGGRPLLDRFGKYFYLTPKKLDESDEWFQKHGDAAVLFGRMIPAVRKVVSIPAGLAGMDIKKFILYSFIGNLPYAFALVYLGYSLGPYYSVVEQYSGVLDYIFYPLVALIVLFIIYRIIVTRNDTDDSKN